MHLSNRQWTLTGWWLFVACAVCFIVAAARAGDMIALAGACLFMAANIAFMIPFYRRPPKDEHGHEAGRARHEEESHAD